MLIYLLQGNHSKFIAYVLGSNIPNPQKNTERLWYLPFHNAMRDKKLSYVVATAGSVHIAQLKQCE